MEYLLHVEHCSRWWDNVAFMELSSGRVGAEHEGSGASGDQAGGRKAQCE